MRRGFTLIEILLSLAIVAAVLVALSSLLFGIVGGWGEGRDTRLFDQHRRALTRQLAESAGGAANRPGGIAWGIGKVRWSGREETPRVTWSVPDAGRLAAWPAEPLPDVDLALEVDPERGLILGFRSRAETDTEVDRWHETVLSPFVRRLEFAYAAEPGRPAAVSETPLPLDGFTGWRQPDHLRLHLEHGREKAEVRVRMGGRREGATPP